MLEIQPWELVPSIKLTLQFIVPFLVDYSLKQFKELYNPYVWFHTSLEVGVQTLTQLRTLHA